MLNTNKCVSTNVRNVPILYKVVYVVVGIVILEVLIWMERRLNSGLLLGNTQNAFTLTTRQRVSHLRELILKMGMVFLLCMYIKRIGFYVYLSKGGCWWVVVVVHRLGLHVHKIGNCKI